jgi:hypothetical protein
MNVTYTAISDFLRKCFFNPRLPGPLKIISDINNSNYYELRAVEFIKEINEDNYHDNIVKAIQLLALSHETRRNESKDFKEETET